jgi:glyoxylate reductase
MTKKILIPWVMPAMGRAVLEDAKAEVAFLHGPRGEMPGTATLIAAILKSDVLIARGDRAVPRKVMSVNPRLRGIANYGVGYNNIDVAYATELGIPVTNTPGVLTETTADLAWALLMATARRIPQAHRYALSGKWPLGGRTFMGLDVGPGGSNRSKVLGIIGFGRIGQAVARRSRGFKMKVIAYDPPLKALIETTRGVAYRDLEDLLRESDFVSVHCPLTAETRHLLGSKEFRLMKPTAVLINTARGQIVHERALLTALQQKKIAAAGLDVCEKEPNFTPGLSRLDNVVLLPHIGSATEDTRGQMAAVAAKNAIAMLRGKRPRNIVNPEVFGSAEYLRRIGK